MLRRADEEAVRIYWATDSHYDHAVEGDPDAPGSIVVGTRRLYTAGAKLRHFVDLANASGAEAVIHTGDMIDKHAQSVDEAVAIWDGLTVPSYVTPGNHDFQNGPTYAQWVTALGYGGRTENAGSAFNHSASVERDGFAVRLITLDSNINDQGNHQSLIAGRLHADARSWLASELSSCPEDDVIIAIHHGPQDVASGYFNASDADAYRLVVEAAVDSRGLKVHTLFGHNHSRTSPMKYLALGGKVPGILAPPVVDHIPGRFGVINIFPSGKVWTYGGDLFYPYP